MAFVALGGSIVHPPAPPGSESLETLLSSDDPTTKQMTVESKFSLSAPSNLSASRFEEQISWTGFLSFFGGRRN